MKGGTVKEEVQVEVQEERPQQPRIVDSLHLMTKHEDGGLA
jgi:hypothetical protein